MLYEILRPLLFRMDPERAHDAVTAALELAQKLPGGGGLLAWMFGNPPDGMEVEAFGLDFPNPVGLAAGFDKDARLVKVLVALGFGFIEVGSITLDPQPGNPKPRIFRVPEASALINSLGFNSVGAEAAVERLKALGRPKIPMGINLGLNAGCPKGEAEVRYAQTFRLLERFGDYFVVNVSSPNTPGLRDLQQLESLGGVLSAIRAVNPRRKPVLVKISPDMSGEDLPGLVALIREKASGVIACNTTLSRDGIPQDYSGLSGGLSGPPLFSRAKALVSRIHKLSGGKLAIVGVGGVSTGRQAFEMIRAGASLVELYTALVYRGPGAVTAILKELSTELSRAGFKKVSEAVGTGALEVAA